MAITYWYTSQNQLVTQTLVVRQSKLDKMTVSKSLKKLASLAYLKRDEHQEDTRAKCIELTKKGNVLIQKLIPIVEKVDQDFFSSIKNHSQKNLATTLSKLTAGCRI